MCQCGSSMKPKPNPTASEIFAAFQENPLAGRAQPHITEEHLQKWKGDPEWMAKLQQLHAKIEEAFTCPRIEVHRLPNRPS